ncbi:MAG: chromate transporter [Clostridia bacterium]|nr:chromate transporter [Clostridia bacterium]
MKEILNLYATFFRIGLFTFGGGYAMLPLIQREVVEKHGWATEDEVMDYYAVGQCTPGVIAVNVGTFIGYRKKGILGGIAATLGVVSPSIIIISIIAACLSHFSDNVYVQHALAGIRLAVCALVSVSIYKLFKKGVVDAVTAVIALVVFVIMRAFDLSPVIAVVASAIVGIIFRCYVKKDGRKSPDKKGESK